MASNKSAKKAIIKWIKRGIGGAFVLGVLAMLVTAWIPKPIPVETGTATTGDLLVTVDEDGRTRVKDRYVVSAPLTGNLARIELRAGDELEEGGVIARIVPLTAPLLDARSQAQAEARVAAARAAQRQARAAIERARVAADFASTEAQRQQRLASQGGASQQAAERAQMEERSRREELTSAQFAARVADYEHEMARAALGRSASSDGEGEQLEVIAPVGGRVLKVIQQSEGVVQAGTPLVEIGDPSALEIVVDVLTSDAVDIVPGARVLIDRWGGETPLEGRVRIVEPSAFTRVSALGVEEQRVNVVIDLDTPSDEWSALGDGYRVEARVIVWQGDDVLSVPASAVFRHEEGWAVYRIADGVADLTPVEIGEQNGLRVQIVEGLSDGDKIVIHPGDRVTDGVEVVGR